VVVVPSSAVIHNQFFGSISGHTVESRPGYSTALHSAERLR
jgi:hypothetical protein